VITLLDLFIRRCGYLLSASHFEIHSQSTNYSIGKSIRNSSAFYRTVCWDFVKEIIVIFLIFVVLNIFIRPDIKDHFRASKLNLRKALTEKTTGLSQQKLALNTNNEF